MIEPLFSMQWGQPGQAMVPALADLVSLYTPADELWVVEAAGIFIDQTPAGPCDFKMQYQVKDVAGNTGGWLVTLHVNLSPMASTPVLALDRRVVLVPHTRLSARVAWSETTTRMGLMFVGFRMPYTQDNLRLLLGGASGAAATAPTVDLTQFTAAAQAAATALATLAQSAPNNG